MSLRSAVVLVTWLEDVESESNRICGIDPSMAMLVNARKNAPRASLVRGRAQGLPFSDRAFDRLFCINALHDFMDAKRFVQEARRVLRPGGGLLTLGIDPHTGLDHWWLYDYFPSALAADRARYNPVGSIRDDSKGGSARAPAQGGTLGKAAFRGQQPGQLRARVAEAGLSPTLRQRVRRTTCLFRLSRAIATLIFLSACSSSDSLPPSHAAIVTLTIGALDDPHYALSRVEGITTSSDGHIFVLQHEDANVREFDSNGTFVRLIGRRGTGPGEFSLPTRLWWSDDDLWVADGNLSRATRFDRSGAPLATQSLAAPFVQLALTTIELLNDSVLLASERVIRGHARFDRDSTPLLRIHGAVADTILWLDVRNATALVGAPGKTFIQTRHPIADNDVVRVQHKRDGFVVARRNLRTEPGGAELLWFDQRGGLLRKRRFNLPRIPVPSAFTDSILDSFASRLASAGTAGSEAAARELARKALNLPDYYPPFGEVLLGEDGSIWVSRGRDQSTQTWLHIGAEGNLAGTVSLPAGIRLMHVAPPHIFGVQQNELGVPFVVRLAVR
ncbi:MAG: methyltransferase domain-containing protein [Gemmatimonadota bacterium]